MHGQPIKQESQHVGDQIRDEQGENPLPKFIPEPFHIRTFRYIEEKQIAGNYEEQRNAKLCQQDDSFADGVEKAVFGWYIDETGVPKDNADRQNDFQ